MVNTHVKVCQHLPGRATHSSGFFESLQIQIVQNSESRLSLRHTNLSSTCPPTRQLHLR